MAQAATAASKQRAERRINVHLPMTVRGRERGGAMFEESTSSENLCRSGAAFRIRRDVMPGTDVEIRISISQQVARRPEADFTTQGRIVYVGNQVSDGDRLVGVQFVGPRFHRVYRRDA